MKIKKGDKVKILSGKDRNKTGEVLATFPKEQRILVEGINIVKKHKRQTGKKDEPGGIVQMEAPIHASKAMVVCPACTKPTRIGYKVTKDSKKRVCKKCSKVIQ